jgi:hypothetical protein
MEAGTHSIWISEQLRQFEHEVLVANVTELHAIVRNISKSDQVDAEKLARYARLDPKILRPITHRSVESQHELTIVRARDASTMSSHSMRVTYEESFVSGPAITNAGRPHRSLGPGIPEPVQQTAPAREQADRLYRASRVIAKPILGGLHHEYQWPDAA